jgi:hypothetical protein
LSRQRYYDLETRALSAMLKALAPGGSSESAATSPERRILELEQRVKQLETEKRRAERLLLLTRKVMRTGRAKPTRPKSKSRRSTTHGSKPSSASKKRSSSRVETTPATAQNKVISASIPTPDGEAAH